MEILQFLLSFLIEEYGGKDFEPLLEILEKNNFDIKAIAKNVPPEQLAPALKVLLGKSKRHSEKPECPKLAPIKKFAGKEIFDCLNEYFSLA